ncbi:MAG: amino acid adenylation domain-containing protein [Rickettsiales bacterium]|nr:amino acid adenylation domain-containing protein [Rickettsiales bacterium]
MTNIYPLTRQQQGLWVEWKRNANDISYNTCVQVEMEGELDVERFKQAANNAVEHFDMLRAYLVEEDLKPYLAFGDEKYELPFTDFSEGDIESDLLRKKAIKFLDDIRLKPIPLDEYPLVNAHLVKTAKNKFYFIGVVPHLISDGVSAVMFLQSLSACYNHGKAYLKENFSYEGVSWVDYLKLCDEKFPQEKYDEAYEYWASSLANVTHKVDIGNKPCHRQSNLGSRFKFDASVEVFARLKKIARANKTGFFSVISASLAAFISRYYAPEDMVIGYPVNLRPAGYRNAFGFYVNVLPLKIGFDKGDSFNDLVRKSHEQRKLDKEFQYLPSIDIIRSKRRSDTSFDGQMFNVSMAQTVSRLQNLELENIKSTSLDNETIEIKDDLSLIYEVREDGISFWFEYLKEIFDESQIADMAQNFVTLLEGMVDDPDRSIGDIDLVLENVSEGLREKFVGLDIISEFKKAVANNYDVDALIFNDQRISYRELDKRSDSLAKYLAQNVVQSERFIALALPYSVERIVAILAVLKAGFAYIPIGEETPIERINTIIEDSGVLTLVSLQRIAVGVANIVLGDLNLSDDAFEVRKSELAYVIYTSGSTGKPKGVLVEQDKVVARINWLKKEFPLRAKDKVLQSTSYSFDVSVAEIFWPLLSGATLVILDEEKRKDFRYQADLIEEHQIKAACMVPSAILALLKAVERDLPFRYLLSAGEAMSRELVEQYYKYGAQGSLYNVYGPTEAVIYASVKKVLKGDKITIGKAIDNSRLYVLNDKLKMQPKNAVGELCIGGDALALGYLHQDQLTKDRFVDSPYGKGKLYRTGDLVSFSDNLEVQYYGRIDSQVKIRGYRIEIGEIESILLDILEIEEVVVFVNENSQLVAAVVVSGDVSDEDIKKYLSKFLPSYMVVQFLVRFDELPKLDSGKINKKLVQNIAKDKILDVVVSREIIKAKTDKEKMMAKIWSDVLRVDLDVVGINSNFFELGGDSLMIIELECLAERQGIYLDSRVMFKNPTIAALLENASDKPINKFNQEMVEGQIGLLPRQIKFFEDGFAKPDQWSRCVVVESKREIDVAKFRESLKEVMDHHDSLRVSFEKINGKWVGNNHGSIDAVVNVHDLGDKNLDDELTREILNKELASFDLGKAPLIKAVYLKFKKHARIALMVHHLLLDMRSMRIILEDLMMNFMAKMQGQTFEFSYKTSSVSDYLAALNRHLEGDFDSEIDYWVGELGPSQDEIDVKESDMDFRNVSLDKKRTKELIQLAAQHDVSLHEVLLAKFANRYFEIFGQDLVLNTCFHGRDQFLDGVKISKTVGWFNTVFPVRIKQNQGDLFGYLKDKLKNIPSRSLNYLPLRFLKKEERLVGLAEPKIFFNYVSKIDRELPKEFSAKLPLKIINVDGLEVIDKSEKSCYELYVEAAIIDEKLQAKIGYLRGKYDERWVESLF